MKLNIKKNRMRSKAFTLVELLVVLLILIAVAGVVVPIIPDILGRVHSGVSSANLEEVAKKVGEFQALNVSLPDNLDSLMDATDIDTIAFGILPENSSTSLEVLDISAGDLREQLESAGITNLYNLDTTAENVTFDAADDEADSNAIDDYTFVASLTPAAITALDLDAGEEYAVFGVGHKSDLVGSVMLDAPVHFPHEGTPATQYERMLIAVGFPEEGPARLATVFTIDDGNAAGLNSHLAEYWEGTAE